MTEAVCFFKAGTIKGAAAAIIIKVFWFESKCEMIKLYQYGFQIQWGVYLHTGRSADR